MESLIWGIYKNSEEQTLMSRIFCFSNSSMVSSSCLVVRVASIVALWSSLSAWWEQKVIQNKYATHHMRPPWLVVAKALEKNKIHPCSSSHTCSNCLQELFWYWHTGDIWYKSNSDMCFTFVVTHHQKCIGYMGHTWDWRLGQGNTKRHKPIVCVLFPCAYCS